MCKTFFLGLGGQKCGSSWIQAQLAKAEGSDFGRLGEYQVWEHQLGGVFARYKVAEPSKFEKLRTRLKLYVGAPEPVAHLRWRLQSDPNAYFDYFAALLDQKGIERTGDITPSYAALPADMLAMISYGFATRGIETKVIFSMRDPVARLKSHFRMDIQKGRIPEPKDFDAALVEFAKSDEGTVRSRYDLTLANISEAFPEGQTHICLFEELFTPKGVQSLSEFSGVPLATNAGGTKVNARQGGSDASENAAKEIAMHYAQVYETVAQDFQQIETLWPQAKAVLTNA